VYSPLFVEDRIFLEKRCPETRNLEVLAYDVKTISYIFTAFNKGSLKTMEKKWCKNILLERVLMEEC
jgi:hypothetical protein